MDFSFNITKSTRNVCITKYVRLYKLLKRYNGNDPKINRVLPLPQGNHVTKLLKIQYTELKLSCGNDPVVKNYIYSNGDLDLFPNDPKIFRILPLLQGNQVVKFGKDPIYKSYHVETTLLSKILFIVSDLDL